MGVKNLGKQILMISACLLGVWFAGPAGAADAPPTTLDNASCQTCHDGRGKKGNLEAAPDAEGKQRPLQAVNQDKYDKSVHAKMQCVACHTDITDNAAPHQKGAAAKVDCAQCHEALWETIKKEGKTEEKPRLGIVVENIAAYKKSFHARPNKEDKSHVNATCNDCHDTHTFDVPARGTAERKEWHLTVPQVCGEKCHSDELEDYSESIHGKEISEKHNLKSAVCSDCHTTHDIGNTSANPVKLAITSNCGGCHVENYKTYKNTYHGQVNTLGYAYTAKCFDCHGSHGILGVKDPKSKVSKDNRLKTCQQCHDGKKNLGLATAGFVTFSPHGNANDSERYPQLWLVTRFMQALLLFVFAYFWTHSLMWWYREYQDRKQHKNRPHVRTEAVPGLAEKYVRRFGTMWRIGHLCFAVSVMLLVLTGTAVLFSDAPWSPAVTALFGGPHSMGIVHRTAAFTMLSIFFIHLIGVSTNILRDWKNFRFFGPNSLVPRWQDFKDAWGMFKWFANKGPRPTFDRWTYWEKFDYWAVFWGMGIIGSSGMMLAFPHVTASIFPGWIFNVATVVHGEEAFLAAVFLFTVHFFNNHFRPDKMPPPDVVMFTGVQTLEEFKREHTEQYQRLVARGELEKYLVDAPSRPFTLGAKILGLTLIGFGLILLALVTVGFFGGAG